MGKKKAAKGGNNPDALKDAGNKAFLGKNYDEAIKLYTQAIEMSSGSPSHIYYSNRGNAQLELHNYEECIRDCEKAIEIDSTYLKSYFRKAKALMNS